MRAVMCGVCDLHERKNQLASFGLVLARGSGVKQRTAHNKRKEW